MGVWGLGSKGFCMHYWEDGFEGGVVSAACLHKTSKDEARIEVFGLRLGA